MLITVEIIIVIAPETHKHTHIFPLCLDIYDRFILCAKSYLEHSSKTRIRERQEKKKQRKPIENLLISDKRQKDR